LNPNDRQGSSSRASATAIHFLNERTPRRKGERSRGATGNAIERSRNRKRSTDSGRIIRRMNPTYAEIAECVERRYGFVPKTCWIAHVKELWGLPVRLAPNRQSQTRMVPCPAKKRSAIEDCLHRLMREKLKFNCPHCEHYHKFTFRKLEMGVWPCNGRALDPRTKIEIGDCLLIDKLAQ
jgi:hypothetical protein